MDSNLLEALKLLGVGLSTVFVVLLLIIGFGNLLIKAVNKFVPEEEVPAKKPVAQNTSAAIDPAVQQAIEVAVQQLTAGKGRVEKIQRL